MLGWNLNVIISNGGFSGIAGCGDFNCIGNIEIADFDVGLEKHLLSTGKRCPVLDISKNCLVNFARIAVTLLQTLRKALMTLHARLHACDSLDLNACTWKSQFKNSCWRKSIITANYAGLEALCREWCSVNEIVQCL